MNKSGIILLTLLAFTMFASIQARHILDKGESRNLQTRSFSNQETWVYWVTGIILIIVGLPMCFWGLVWWCWNSWILAVFGAFNIMQVIILISGTPGYESTDGWKYFWFILLGCVITGAVIIFWLVKKLAAGCIGGYIGCAAVLGINSIIISIRGEPTWWWLVLIIAVLCIVPAVILGCKYHKDMIILGSSIIGGFAVVGGVGYITGHWPASRGNHPSWYGIMYLCGAIILVALGMFVQCRYGRKHDKNNYNLDSSVTVELRSS